jgi:hypothetical protein
MSADPLEPQASPLPACLPGCSLLLLARSFVVRRSLCACILPYTLPYTLSVGVLRLRGCGCAR